MDHFGHNPVFEAENHAVCHKDPITYWRWYTAHHDAHLEQYCTPRIFTFYTVYYGQNFLSECHIVHYVVKYDALLWANSALWKGSWCCWSGMDSSFTWQRDRRFLYFLLSKLRLNWFLRLGCCKKSQAHFSKIFISEKGLSGCASETAWLKVFEMMFFRCLMKTSRIKCAKFLPVLFCLGEIPRRPSEPSISHPKNNVFWVHMGFLLHRTEQAAIKNFDFFRKESKKTLFSNFLVEPFKAAEPESPFPGIKISEESTWLFWNFDHGQKLVQPSLDQMKNVEKLLSLCRVRETFIPDEQHRAGPPKKHRVARNALGPHFTMHPMQTELLNVTATCMLLQGKVILFGAMCFFNVFDY